MLVEIFLKVSRSLWAADTFSPALLGKLPFHHSASANASVQKPARCMEVPVKHDQGLQKVPVCALAHVSSEGHSSLPLSRHHCPSPMPCALPAPASPAQARAEQSTLCSCPHHHRSLPLPSEPTYFTHVQEGYLGPQGRGPARSHHQNPSRTFAHPFPGFRHVLMLQITSEIPEQLQTLPAPFKREQ